MAVKFYFYIDYGGGFTQINPVNIACKIGWERGVLNDYISRKILKGNFTLSDTEYTAAETYFIQMDTKKLQ